MAVTTGSSKTTTGTAALFVAIATALAAVAGCAPAYAATARTSAPSGCLSVCSNCTYTTLTSAVAALGSGTSAACIFLDAGTYTEQVTIKYGGALTLYGYTSDVSSYKNNGATITHSVNSSYAGSLDASSTVNIVATGFKAYNISWVERERLG
ncbi:hypothetical protein HK405_003791, partial [Cladochytrium tenue]